MKKKVVIVGGGTSGWMAASFLNKTVENIEITVVEAPSIPRIGVGEATIPNLQTLFFDTIGIKEDEWTTKVGASYKMGIKFVDWTENPIPGREDAYYHLFGTIPDVDGIPLPLFWNERRINQKIYDRFDTTLYSGGRQLIENKISPRDYEGKKLFHYAWHFDANLLSEFLKEKSLSWGVKLVPEHVESVNKNEEGFILSVETREGSTIEGDYFIDCTGFRSVLMGQQMAEPFIDLSHELFCDSAVATRIPHPNGPENVEPVTTAKAMKYGWKWHIPLLDRVGTGYVYSSKFTTQDQAIEEFAKEIGVDPEKTQFNKIKFPVGRRKRAWVKNCIAVGISANFLEPLESTALYLTYGAIYMFSKHFPHGGYDQKMVDAFNDAVAYSYDDAKDFVQMHYKMTRRNDTKFWEANQKIQLSERNMARIEKYLAGEPIAVVDKSSTEYYNDFDYEFNHFWSIQNYYAVLTGMRVYPLKVSELVKDSPARAEADKIIGEMKDKAETIGKDNPNYHDYLNFLHGKGIAKGTKN